RTAALVGDREFLADAEDKMRVVVEEERRDVVVVDEEQHVGALVGEPLLHGLVALEDRRPDGVVLLTRVERKADRRRVRTADAADDRRHAQVPLVRQPSWYDSRTSRAYGTGDTF